MKKAALWPVLLIGCVCLVIGILLGSLITTHEEREIPIENDPGLVSENDLEKATAAKIKSTTMIIHRRIRGLKAANIKKNLKYLTKKTHVGGTSAEETLGDWIYSRWKRGGFDKVEKKGYDALLSYPSESPDEVNKVEIVAINEETDEYTSVFETKPEILDDTIKNENIMPPYTAYAKKGVVTADLVYANYGTVDDFIQLQYKNVRVEGNIVICRYDKIYRGDKARNAIRFGAIGLILYTEPNLFSSDWETYPDGIYLPKTGVQRGSIALEMGDPQTPGYPSVDGSYRIPEENISMPQIPVHPISGQDARYLLRQLGGEQVNMHEWRGYLPNVTYRYGPGFVNETEKVRLCVYNRNEVRKIYNIIGTIYGRTEPDRYVLVGNHRDAWVYGAVDPSAATAVMMEIADVFGTLKKKMNWRPRRTIKFCSWAAEEFALIGSNEFVEDYDRILSTRAVAYLNLDIIVQGNYTLSASASPNLKEAMFAAARMVPDPDGTEINLYDIWKDRQLANIIHGTNFPPRVYTLGAGSDYASFVRLSGVAAMNVIYVPNPHEYIFSIYPLYHTVYETFHLVKTLMDPEFIYHRAIGQFFGFLLLSLSNNRILPLNCNDYAIDLETHFKRLNDTYAEVFAKHGIILDHMGKSVADLKEEAKLFHRRISFTDTSDVLGTRRINDQLIMFERAFIDPMGLPNRPYIRNVIYASSKENVYNSAKFPGIVDAMYEIEYSDDPTPEMWTGIERHVATITHAIRSAIYVLEPFHQTD